MVNRSGLRYDANGSASQRYPPGRKSQSGERGRKAARLLREEHAVVVVISSRDLGHVVRGAAVMMRRQTRAQRPKDEEQRPCHEFTGWRTSHTTPWLLCGYKPDRS